MTNTFDFRTLSAADRLIFLGNVAAIIGSLLVAVGSVMRLAEGGALPSGQPVFIHPGPENHQNSLSSGNAPRAREYFGL